MSLEALVADLFSQQFLDPLDVLLLLDASRSMEPHVRRIATASHQALRASRAQDRIAIMVFDRSTRVRMASRPLATRV